MLQDAYRGKAKERIFPAPRNGQIDFLALLAAFTSAATTTRMETVTTTEESLVIPARDLQLEQLFPKQNITGKKQYSPVENFTTEEMIENMTITSTELNQYDYPDTTEDEEPTDDILTSTSSLSFSEEDSTIATDTSMNEAINDTESLLNTVIQMTDVTSSVNDNETNSTAFTPLSSITIPNKHNQLLQKLCHQIFSRIFPNASSSLNSSAILSKTANNTLNALLSWLNNHLNSTKTSLTTTPMSSSYVTDEIEYSSSEPLQRVDMDDVLHQMNNYVDEENLLH